MKTLNLLIIGLLIAFVSNARTDRDGYAMFYNHYNDYDGIITFKLPGSIASNFIEDADEIEDFAENIDKISFLIADKASRDMILDLNKSMPESRYKTMMEIRDGSSEVQFFAREDGTVISEIVMTVIDGNSLVVMCIFGDFTKEDAKLIVKSVKTDSAVQIRM